MCVSAVLETVENVCSITRLYQKPSCPGQLSSNNVYFATFFSVYVDWPTNTLTLLLNGKHTILMSQAAYLLQFCHFPENKVGPVSMWQPRSQILMSIRKLPAVFCDTWHCEAVNLLRWHSLLKLHIQAANPARDQLCMLNTRYLWGKYLLCSCVFLLPEWSQRRTWSSVFILGLRGSFKVLLSPEDLAGSLTIKGGWPYKRRAKVANGSAGKCTLCQAKLLILALTPSWCGEGAAHECVVSTGDRIRQIKRICRRWCAEIFTSVSHLG